MAQEPFLINPPRVLGLRLRRTKGLPVRLRHWGVVSAVRKPRRKVGKFLRRYNPIGETLVTVGANPRRRFSMVRRRVRRYGYNPLEYIGVIRKLGKGHYRYDYVSSKRKRSRKVSKRRVRRNPENVWFGRPRRHRRAALKEWRGRRRHYSLRRYRRNPAVSIGGIVKDVTDFGNWLPLAISGGVGVTVTAVLPGMLAGNVIVQPMYGQFVKYGIQLVNAFGGGVLVGNFFGKKHGDAWMITSISYVGYQLLRDWVFKPFLPQLATGLGEYEQYYSDQEPYQTVGSGTGYGVQAFPEAQMSAYPEEVSAYPYDGRYGY